MTGHWANGADSDLLNLLEALTRIESVNPGLDATGSGEAPIASYVADWGRTSGLSVEVLERTSGRPSVLLRGGRDRGGRRLLFCGHLDTVGLGPIDTQPRIEQDRLYARGAYDMKAGLAAALIAGRDAVDVGIDGEIVVAAVSDEELASLGVQEVLAHLDPASFDAAVVTEPTERQIGVSHRGFVWTEITVTGVAAHGSRPHLGADAILAVGPLLVAFGDLDAQLRGRLHSPGNVHGSLITGGTEESTIPDRCVITLERRTVPGESLAQVEADVAAVLARSTPADPRINVSARTVLHRQPMQTPEDADIVRALQAAAGAGVQTASMSYWADSAFLAAAGIPTVLYGPDGEGAHADIEWVSRSGTTATARTLTALTLDFCN